MSDTPRTDAEAFLPHDSKYRVCDVDLARTLERELNAANVIIRQQQLLEEKNLRLQERIKRLESDAISAKWMWMMNYCKTHGFSPTLGWESAEKAWTAAFETKEAKP